MFGEAFRALKSGGRLLVSDIVLLKELPESLKNSVRAYVGCLSGASLKDDYLNSIKGAGFRDVKIVEEVSFPVDYIVNDPTGQAILKEMKVDAGELARMANEIVLSVKVSAVKP